MKKSKWTIHLVYGLVIVTLIVGMLGLNQARISVKMRLHSAEESEQEDIRIAFANLCSELSGDLYSAVEADQLRLYLSKMTQIQIAAGQAMLLLSSDGRQTPWITFWESLDRYAEDEINQSLESNEIPNDRKNLTQLAKITNWLAENPGVLLDETTESLPDELKLPTLQTAYAVEESKTRQVAQRVLNTRGVLTYLKNSPPGIRSYICKNARVDVLQSGKLLYLSLTLKKTEGVMPREEAAEAFIQFARKEGFGNVQIIDLYIEDGIYRGKLAPLSWTAEFGRIPDLDRTIEIGCTAWNGRICYFSAGRYFTAQEQVKHQGAVSESKIEALAKEQGARIGPAFLYRSRICRPLIYERGGFAGRVVLCVDVSTVESVDLFYYAHPRIGEKTLF